MTRNPDVAVTVVIPAYNAARTIASTLESVIAQTHTNWEAVVVDDHSSDETRAIVEGFAARDSRIRLLALEKNNGAPAAPRNRGLESASSPWVAFLDSDDLWHPQKLELQLEALSATGETFSCTAMRDFADGASVVDTDVLTPVQTHLIAFANHRIKGRIPASSVVVSTELARRFPFEEDRSYKAVEDYHCWLRILHSGVRCLKLDAPLLNYRRIVGQISGSKLTMMRRVFHVHRNFEQTSPVSAAFFTGTHVLFSVYLRFNKKGL
ncbi:glycosyltransferase family 2 protein [Hoeflea sp. Naph1]|uniref:glycosyltransferase family 2 protein n=1 Tax=Hoeflea sp. Naph1 TaxID=3388653 RepID=UPI00398FFFA6